jgi:HSP20 family protein
MRITTDPTRELSLLQGDVNRVFERFFGPQPAAATAGRWIPALDITEEGDRFLLHLDLPGMTEDDIELELEDRVLRISGERRDTRAGASDGGFRRLERTFGRFERTLTLPRGVDAEAIEATFEHGVLEIAVPKPAEARPRRIAVNGRTEATEIEAHGEERELANT